MTNAETRARRLLGELIATAERELPTATESRRSALQRLIDWLVSSYVPLYDQGEPVVSLAVALDHQGFVRDLYERTPIGELASEIDGETQREGRRERFDRARKNISD